MGQISVITPKQEIILGWIRNDQILGRDFYFTGGTALAEFYLQHRYSDDLDFFSPKELDQEYIFARIENWSKKEKFKFKARFVEVVYRFTLDFPNGAQFRVDFGHYPYRILEKCLDIRGLQIDSLKDIAVNKFLTLSQRTDVKDFVDLYFLLKDEQFTVWDLIYGKEAKFKMETDILLLAQDFLKVEDFDFLPKMIKPVSLDELKSFFRSKAKEVGRKAVE